MAVFIDTGIFVGAFFERDQNHEKARELFEKAYRQEKWGKLFTSDYVLDEFISRMISQGRLKGKGIDEGFLDKITRGEDAIQNSKVNLLQVTDEVIADAKIYFKEHYRLGLTLTDWTIATLMRDNEIGHLLTFDSGFFRLKEVTEFEFLKIVR